jgi:hypothetical protein
VGPNEDYAEFLFCDESGQRYGWRWRTRREVEDGEEWYAPADPQAISLLWVHLAEDVHRRRLSEPDAEGVRWLGA